MFMVIAVVNQDNLQNILEDLFSNNIEGITVTQAIGKGSFGLKEADDLPTDLVDKVRLEIVVSDVDNRELAMECIRSNSHDLGRGAGKMWWLVVGGVERIRTGEKDEDALTTQVNKKIQNTPYGITTHIDTPCS